MELPCDPAILLPGVYPKELKAETQTDICTLMFIAALFTIVKHGNDPNVHQGMMDIQNVVYMYNVVLFNLQKE